MTRSASRFATSRMSRRATSRETWSRSERSRRFRTRRAPIASPATISIPRQLQIGLARGISTGAGIAAIEHTAGEVLPSGFGFEWTEIALQEKLAGNTAIYAFGLAVVFVFLLLAALYESWLLPLAVILIVPMCILAAMLGVNAQGLDRNILGRDRARRPRRASLQRTRSSSSSLQSRQRITAPTGARQPSRPHGPDCVPS